MWTRSAPVLAQMRSTWWPSSRAASRMSPVNGGEHAEVDGVHDAEPAPAQLAGEEREDRAVVDDPVHEEHRRGRRVHVGDDEAPLRRAQGVGAVVDEGARRAQDLVDQPPRVEREVHGGVGELDGQPADARGDPDRAGGVGDAAPEGARDRGQGARVDRRRVRPRSTDPAPLRCASVDMTPVTSMRWTLGAVHLRVAWTRVQTDQDQCPDHRSVRTPERFSTPAGCVVCPASPRSRRPAPTSLDRVAAHPSNRGRQGRRATSPGARRPAAAGELVRRVHEWTCTSTRRRTSSPPTECRCCPGAPSTPPRRRSALRRRSARRWWSRRR